MSTKLSVCAYTVIVDFTLFYLALLKIITPKKIEGKCNSFNTSTLTSQITIDQSTQLYTKNEYTTEIIVASTNQETIVETLVPTNSFPSTIMSSTTITSKLNTFISIETTNVILGGEVGSPCTSFADCLGGQINGTLGVYQTMDCNNNICQCKDPYTRVVYKPNYQCAIPNGNTDCIEDIECVGTCSSTGNINNGKKCTG